MPESLRVEPDQLRALKPEFDAIAHEAQLAVKRLKETIAREGDCWGQDEPGKSFEKTYLPDAKRGIKALEQTVENLQSLGKNAATIADNFEQVDQDVGRQVDRAGQTYSPVNTVPAAQQMLNGQMPQQLPVQQPVPVRAQSPTGAQAPDTGRSPDAGNSPGSDNGPGDNDNGQDSGSDPNSRNGNPSDDPGQGQPGGPISAAPTGATAGPNGRTAVAPTSSTPPPVAKASAGPTSTPWSRAGGAGGGSGAAGGPPKVSAPGPQGPGNPASPGSPGRPANSPWAPQKKKDEEKDKKAVSVGADEPDNSQIIAANKRLGQSLADRHDIEVVGFDLPGLAEHTARELASAVDDMLAKYPTIALRLFGIADLTPGEVTRLEWDREPRPEPSSPKPFTKRVLFSKTAALNADRFAELVTAATQSGDLTNGADNRPVYSAIVRELGHALDVAGGFHARRQTQHALVNAFVRQQQPDPDEPLTDPLGAVVGGYRHWRNQLSGYSFPAGRFDPGMALADAFTEVEMRGFEAGRPAKVLHRLLVTTARTESVS